MCESFTFYCLVGLRYLMLQYVTDGVIYTLTVLGRVSSRVA